MDVSDEALEALYQATYRLERAWMPPTPDASKFHAYDPLPWAIFLPLIEQGIEAAPPSRRFLDVGCGIGTKLLFMHYLGWQVAGIERHPPYAHAARLLVPEAEVTPLDAFDVESFDADIVYAYRPCIADDLQERLEDHIIRRMPPGSVLLLPARPDPVRVI